MKQIPPSDDQLGELLRERASYHTAPTALRQALLKNTGEAGPRRTRRPWLVLLQPRFAWLAGGFAAGMLALWLVQPWLGAGSAPADMTSLLVDSHLRSLQQNHLADVLSSDRHTVKPWFAGKLDYTPPVRDFANEGFPLAGARLEVLRGRTVAVLVYRHRLHWINMFAVPGATAVAPPRKLAGLRGFQLVQWQAEGIQYTLVSDLNGEELLQLAAIASGAAAR
jgi:anti-sigma factor RsiW